MNTQQMMPPDDGTRNYISFNGRVYSSSPGVATPVPKFDVPTLAANGWTIASSAPLPTTTSAYFNGAVSGVLTNPNGPSAGIAVRVYIDGSPTPIGVTIADSDGNWSVPMSGVSTGIHSFSVEIDTSAGVFTIGPVSVSGLIANLDLSIGVAFFAWL